MTAAPTCSKTEKPILLFSGSTAGRTVISVRKQKIPFPVFKYLLSFLKSLISLFKKAFFCRSNKKIKNILSRLTLQINVKLTFQDYALFQKTECTFFYILLQWIRYRVKYPDLLRRKISVFPPVTSRYISHPFLQYSKLFFILRKRGNSPSEQGRT